MKRFGSLVLSTLAAVALVVGSVSAPAFADDIVDPSPSGTVEPTAEPSEEPTTEPEAAPTSTPTPTPSPTAGASRGAPVAPTAPGTQDVTGRVTELGDQSTGSVKVFTVPGEGYLSIDFSAVTLGDPAKTITVRVAVPAGFPRDENGLVPFSALATVNTPLVATQLVAPSLRSIGVESMVNQTPAVAATHQVYAVAVTPKDVCGVSCSATSSQSAANIQLHVAAANSYWLAQSDGRVGFELVGTTAWYKSAFNCDANVPTNFVNLLNEATAKATAQIGYVHTSNSHLVLIFPTGSNCGPAVGVGTIGYSLNEAGALWAIGSGHDGVTEIPTEYHTLAHELGHNLSLGHANWLDCSSATPAPGNYGTTGCTVNPYGDAADVMGQGDGVNSAGSLSSPHAIRSGLWAAASYAVAPLSSTSYTLKPLSSGAGLRSVVVEGNNGVNYFVEYRDTSGIDAPYATLGCPFYAGLCTATTAGVRILQLEQQTATDDWGDTYEFKGFPGDDSYLIGRTVAGVKRVNFVAGESITIAGLTISVTGITGAGAAVTVQRNNYVNSGGVVYIQPTAGSGSSWPWYAGDTLTAMLGSSWKADSYQFQWARNGDDISGATQQNYTLTSADVGQYLGVRVVSYKSGSPANTGMDPDLDFYLGYGPIAAGIAKGSVSINASTLPFTAVPAGWTTTGVTYAYQWRRNGAAISGATSASYTPTALDDGALLSVKLTATKSGSPTVVAVSASKNYTLTASGALGITGTLEVGQVLSADSSLTYSTLDGPVSPTFTYQWYRTGVAIAGATASTYTLASADLSALITVRVFARATGYAGNTFLSTATTAVLRGDIAGSLDAPVVTENTATLLLTVALPGGSVTEPGVSFIRQWFRDGVAVVGATAVTYQLTAADYGKAISARVIATKLGFNSAALYSSPINYSVAAAGSLTVVGTPQVGLTVSASALTYSTSAGAITPALSYVWLRNGVAIAGAAGATYALVAADFGTALSVRVTATELGFLPNVTASPAAALAVKGVLSGDLSVPVVSKNSTVLLTAALPGTSVTDGGVALAYQWLRNGVAIVGATAATFQLTVADYDKNISVRVTVSKLNYTSVVLTSATENYSVNASGALTVTGTLQVGLTVAPSALTYSTTAGAVSPATAYVWYRNGVVIAGATASTYVLVAADFGAKISVRVTATEPGFLSHVLTSPLTATTVVKGVLTGDWSVPVVTKNPTTLLLTAALPGTSVTDLGTAKAYQWLRDGVAIPLATAATFQLTAADYNKNISVRVTVAKLNYISAVFTSVEANHSVVASSPAVVLGTPQVGLTVSATLPTYSTSDGAVTPVEAYIWYRNGVVIAGATVSTYPVVAADFGTKLSVRITAPQAGFLTFVSTSAQSAAVVKGVFTGDLADPDVTKNSGTMLLTSALAAGSVTDSGIATAYQWFRDGAAIASGTAATFQLTAADYGKNIHVRLTVTKLNYTTVTLLSDPVNYSLMPSLAIPIIEGAAEQDDNVFAQARTFTAGGSIVTPDLVTHQWLRDGIAIPGSTTTDTYFVVPADVSHVLSVKVTATYAGFLSSTSTSASTQKVGVDAFANYYFPATVTKGSGTTVLTAVPGETETTGVTRAWQWYRDGVAIAGATAVTYTATAADYGKAINVRITSSKPTLTTVVAFSAPINYSVAAAGTLTVVGIPQVGQTVEPSILTYSTSEGAVTPILSYVWYRNGVAIPGTSGPSAAYQIQAADYGTKLSVRVTAPEPGFVSYVLTSPQTATTVIKGVLSGDYSVPVVTKSGTLLLTAALPGSSIFDSGTTKAHQWLRDGVAIPLATAATFQLTAADYNKNISVRVTVSKLNFNSVILTSATTYYSVASVGALTVIGTLQIGLSVSASSLLYSTTDGPVSPALAYQWYRNGVAIAGSIADTYPLVAADFGAKLSVRVTATELGFLPSVVTSPQTAAVALKGVLTGDMSLPVVSKSPTLLLSVALPGSSIFNSGVALAYQWLRNGVAVVGATSGTFQLTAADYDKFLSVRVTVSKLNYTSVVLTSTPRHDSVSAVGSLTVVGTLQVGQTLSASLLSYGTTDGPASPGLMYVWYRNGVAIAGATLPTYELVAADFGTKLSVRVTAPLFGFLSSVVTSPLTATTVVKGVLSGDLAVPVVSKNGSLLLTAALPGSSVTNLGTATAYQWLRDGVAIVGATAATFQLTATDYNKNIAVRVTVSKLNYTSVALTSDAENYSVIPSAALPAFTGPVEQGELLTLAARTFTADGDPITPTVTYQWLRDAVAIPTATGDSYTPLAADLGKAISVRVTAAESGFLSSVSTSASTQKIGVDSLTDWSLPVTVAQGVGPSMVLTATPGVTGPATPVLSYAWYRNGVVIAGATSATYVLVAADFGTKLSVRVTAPEAGFLSSVVTSPLTATTVVKGFLFGDLSVPVVTKSPTLLLTAALPGTSVLDLGTATAYQWLRDGVVIAGATAATFQLTVADYNKNISVRVTVSKLNYNPVVLTSTNINANYSVTAVGALTVVGTLQVGQTLSASALTYSTAAGSVTPTLSYQWYRNAVAIAGATSATYPLVAADFGTKISVRVTATELGFLPHVVTSPQTATTVVKGFLFGDLSVPVVTKSPTLLLTAALPGTSVLDLGTATAYQWLRDGVVIAGATAATFQLTAADYNKNISVRVTVSKLNYISVVLTSTTANYSVTSVGSLLASGIAQVGLTLSASSLTYSTSDGPVTPGLGYQWLRNGVVLAGATASTYVLVAADYGTKISVRVTATEAGFLTSVVTSPQTASVALGLLSGSMAAPTVTNNTVTAKLTAALTAGSVTDPGIAVAYQWYRNGVAISGATAAIYTLAAADFGLELKARLVVTKLNYTTVTLYSAVVIP